MLTKTLSKNQIYELSKKNNEPDWLSDKRSSALSLFKQEPMPSFIYGLNIHLNIDLNLSDLDTTKSKIIKKEIINKDENVKIFNFDEAINKELLKEKFMTLIKADDKFTTFHNAFVDNLLFIYIPKNTEVKHPIEILTKINSELSFDHLIVVVDDNSKVTLVDNIISENDNKAYISKIVEIFVGNNSKINYCSLQTLNNNTFNFVKKRAALKNRSIINWVDCCFGGKTITSEITTNLDGEGAESNNFGIFLGDKNQQFDLVNKSIHNARNTFSDIFTKGALLESSKCIYRGLVKINRNAGESNGYQKEDTLILSPNAVADSIPDLEIDNSDVKCSHGATIGKPDEEKLFYIRSRGFKETEATEIYVRGFFNELLNKLEIETLRKNIGDLIENKISGKISFNAEKIKEDFPIFKSHPKLTYLDNAATSQRPKQVIKVITDFYEKENANIHRGVYNLSEIATKKYNDARSKIASFINANSEEIIFTKNTTESINLLANTIKPLIKEGKDEILLSEMEHHSNLVPWQQFAKKHNFKLKFIPITENYELDYEKAKDLITEKTAILAVTHVSNTLGTVNDIKTLINLAKKSDVLTIIDAAQSVPHMKVDVKELNPDFLAFSSHKIFGPFGIGILYGKKELLEKLPPFQLGGGMINKVLYEETTFAEIPEKFEAGTQNIESAIAFAEAIKYIEKLGINNIEKHEKELLSYALEKFKTLQGVTIYNPGEDKSIAVLSFLVDGVHPHDVASILDEQDIAIRAGHHCCMPLMKKLDIPGTCRASFSIYNTKEDVDKLIKAIKKVQEIFK